MLFIYGRPTTRIKYFADHSHACKSCGSFDLSVGVYRQYFHIFFIPIAAFGVKTAKIHCSECTEPYRSDSLQQHYEGMARTPIRLYAGTILVSLLILTAIALNLAHQGAEPGYIKNPKVGDIYLLKEKTLSIYYFMKVIEVKKDSIITHHNAVQYMSYVSEPAKDDSFMIEELWISKKNLQEMYDKGIIQSVNR